MHDPAGPQLPQRVKKASYDTINVKLKSDIIVRSNQISLQNLAQVNKAAGTIEKELRMASKSDNGIQEEVDLMNFDDDWLNSESSNFANDPIKEVVQNVHVSMIDQLLCDLNFGSDPIMTKDEPKGENVNNVQENKMTQNEWITPKHSEQETSKIEMDDKMMSQSKSKDVLTFRVPPVSSLVNSMKEALSSDPSHVELANGTQPLHTYATNTTQTTGPSRVKPVNGMQLTVVPHNHNTEEIQTDIISPAMEMKRQKPIGKPRRRKIYSFIELLIYQFSPITKELHNYVNEKFSHYVVDYDLLNDNSRTTDNQSRRPGVFRGTIHQQRSGWNRWNGQGLDAWDRSMDCNNRVVTSSTRNHFESPLELSFLKECVIAQNRWTALLHERELRTSCIKEVKNCKDMEWINTHMNFTNKHSENCLTRHMINDQKNKAIYGKNGKNIQFEEKDGRYKFKDS